MTRRLAVPLVFIAFALAVAACDRTSDTEPTGDESPSAADVAPTPVVEPSDNQGQLPAPAPENRTGLSAEDLLAPTTERPEGIRFDVRQWSTDFSKHSVPLEEFWQAIPFKDGIQSIDEPAFVESGEARAWLGDLEPVIEIEIAGTARAYPLKILTWHEIVNDTLEGVPIAVTFCPLCYTALAFDRRIADTVLEFGVSGALRNSDLVMYDRQTESWWQQFSGEALVGELLGSVLEPVPAAIVGFGDFAARHPAGEILSIDTGQDLNYDYNPYIGYDRIDRPVTRFHANAGDDRLLPRARVVLLDREDDSVVVPFAALEKQGRIELEVGGERLELLWVTDVRSALDDLNTTRSEVVGSADVRSLETGERVAFDTPFWFAVAAFRPETRIVTANE